MRCNDAHTPVNARSLSGQSHTPMTNRVFVTLICNALQMRAGSKSEAKSMMAAAGVPVVPGYHGADQSEDR